MPKTRSLRSLVIGNTGRSVDPGPPSPTLSEATNVSALNFGSDGPSKIITRNNLKASLQAYENLINTCANYRAVLMTLSKATAAFADAMQTCSTLKGPSYEAGTRLQAASGLHHLMGNHWHVLAETLDKSFEKPLRTHLTEYRTAVTERSTSYERALREKSRIIRETEMSQMKKKGRNLQSFREALAVLQRQVDDLDELKVNHYQEIVEHEEEVWDFVQGKVTHAVRTTMDVFDRFTAKSSDPVIEHMLQAVPDPFDSYGPPPGEDQIFSILPPLSIIGNPTPTPSASVSQLTTPVMEHATPLTTPGWATVEPWADVRSNSPSSPPSTSNPVSPQSASPRSISPRPRSPPAGVPRRNPGHQQRKSGDTKMRNVLSVIDESSGSRAREDRASDTGSDITVNGDSQRSTWTPFGLGLETAAGSEGDPDQAPHSSMFPSLVNTASPYLPSPNGDGAQEQNTGHERERSVTPVSS
ncbi:hypothetical protein PUNSTDRAFT_100393 [Punctularia strigosozonata HHB-11173 SS5]|uniref:uncharacterized protein n=1 Tax=Punctularia strigosozonata (strain HHB-11173) TaxID=741275 RepID=UPI0004417E65|nr:uncharacterized protein PUNSTDRAFT_100393 [Punctularia strigosozonata HHB-11173 SS5]EIN10683.1 hypothetical protein PUNSTDRAFT_100393 [Punctularia strigosozonata HHB-11173 SS5]